MTPSGQDAMTSLITKVEEGIAFTDETTLVVYSARVTGPGAKHVGAAVTEDFD